MLVRPQRRRVEKVDEPVAVRPDDRHPRRGFDQGALQHAAVACFEKARGVADRPAGAGARERGDDIDGCVPVNADECRIGHAGEIGDGSERGASRHGVARGVHRPQRAGEPHPVALLRDPRRFAPADHRDAPRADETRKPHDVHRREPVATNASRADFRFTHHELRGQ